MNNLMSSYQKLCDRVAEISLYISMIMSQSEKLLSIKELTLSQEQNQYIDYLRSLSGLTIQYNAIVISLYGCFENYLDDLFGRFIEIVFEKTINYDDLPMKIKEKYRAKLGEYLTSPQRFNGLDLEINTVIKNYNNMLNSDFSSSINKEFLLSHSGNFRIQQILSFMNELGIEDAESKLFGASLLKDYHINIVGLEEIDYETKRKRKSNDLFFYLDILVEQRNNVAHGWSKDNRISTYDIVTYVTPFILKISETLLRICINETFKYVEESYYSFSNKQPIEVFRNNILCINNQGQNIKKGDYLIYKSNTKTKCAKICNIEINHIKVECTDNKHVDVGFELDDNIKKTDIVCHAIVL